MTNEKTRQQEMELEAQHYWRVMQENLPEGRGDSASEAFAELQDELGVLETMSDWPRMQIAAARSSQVLWDSVNQIRQRAVPLFISFGGLWLAVLVSNAPTGIAA